MTVSEDYVSPPPPTRVFVLAVVLLKELLFKHMTGGPEEKTKTKTTPTPRPPAPHSFPKDDDDDDQTERNGAPLVRSQQTCPPCFWGLQISIQSSFNNTTNVNILFPS